MLTMKYWSTLREDFSFLCMYKFCYLVGRRRNVPKALLSSASLFYIHHVFLFPMKLVAFSSAVWQIRCAVKWSMTEGRARLDPLQSYTAIIIFFISVGKYPRMGKKITPNLSEERAGVAMERAFLLLFICLFEVFVHPLLPDHLLMFPRID